MKVFSQCRGMQRSNLLRHAQGTIARALLQFLVGVIQLHIPLRP